MFLKSLLPKSTKAEYKKLQQAISKCNCFSNLAERRSSPLDRTIFKNRQSLSKLIDAHSVACSLESPRSEGIGRHKPRGARGFAGPCTVDPLLGADPLLGPLPSPPSRGRVGGYLKNRGEAGSRSRFHLSACGWAVTAPTGNPRARHATV